MNSTKFSFLNNFDNKNKYKNYCTNLNREENQEYKEDNKILLNIFFKKNIRSIDAEINSICKNPYIKTDQKSRLSKTVRYDNKKNKWDGITIFINKYIYLADKIKSKYKIAYLWESKSIRPKDYQYFLDNKNNVNKFDLILTYNKEILERYYPKAVYIPTSSPTLDYKYLKLYKKTKYISFMNNENKNKGLYGYILRKQICEYINQNHLNIDIYKGGNSKEKWVSKIDFLKDYKFTIICLNSNIDFYMVDQLIDPLVCGTIPIYYGPNIESINIFFNKNGFLYFNNIIEFINIINNLDENYYHKNYDAVKDNFEKIKEYYDIDDIIYNTIKKFLKIS